MAHIRRRTRGTVLGFTWDGFDWTNERGQTPWEEKLERELASAPHAISREEGLCEDGKVGYPEDDGIGHARLTGQENYDHENQHQPPLENPPREG
jgi:hypothetical protein